MASSTTFVIVGGGLAGAKAVEALRRSDFGGRIILFGDEEHLPYDRPPLSKEFLAGKKSLSDFTIQTSDWYRDHDVDVRLGVRVSSLDRSAHTVELPDGAAVRYDKLLLATGSAPRRPPIPGSDAAGVHYLRSYNDAVALNSVLVQGSSLAVVGAGWIGLEVVLAAHRHGRLPGTRLTRSGILAVRRRPVRSERVSGDRVAIGAFGRLCRTVLRAAAHPVLVGVGDRCAGPQSVWRSGRRRQTTLRHRRRWRPGLRRGTRRCRRRAGTTSVGAVVPVRRITASGMAGADHNRGCRITGR